MSTLPAAHRWFAEARYGLFIHYGLYSLLGRGEWAMNREHIPPAEYARLADRFTAEHFDADELIGRAARDWGMRYAVLTTKHHDGFCLYDSQLTDFTAPKTACKRDLVAEFVAACRKYNLRIALYHTLNDWTHSPNAVDALNDPANCYEPFIQFVHGQIREIMTRYGKIDTMWYDGWWPFDGKGWQGEKLNAMVRGLQPGILVNSRCAVPGDFSTPEGHITASAGLWEGCMTLNDHWGYHAGDQQWKSPAAVCEMLRRCSSGQGNLLLNIGPMGDGTVPPASVDILNRVGAWLKQNGEAIFNTERCEYDLRERASERGDWTSHGPLTAAGNHLYWHLQYWPGTTAILGGLEATAKEITDLSGGARLSFVQEPGRLLVTGLPATRDTSVPVVLRITCDAPPVVYNCGGCTVPKVPHCRYDPVTSDIQH